MTPTGVGPHPDTGAAAALARAKPSTKELRGICFRMLRRRGGCSAPSSHSLSDRCEEASRRGWLDFTVRRAVVAERGGDVLFDGDALNRTSKPFDGGVMTPFQPEGRFRRRQVGILAGNTVREKKNGHDAAGNACAVLLPSCSKQNQSSAPQRSWVGKWNHVRYVGSFELLVHGVPLRSPLSVFCLCCLLI